MEIPIQVLLDDLGLNLYHEIKRDSGSGCGRMKLFWILAGEEGGWRFRRKYSLLDGILTDVIA